MSTETKPKTVKLIKEGPVGLLLLEPTPTEDFPWYENDRYHDPEGYLDDYGQAVFSDKVNAILEFGGYWKGVGPTWRLYMDEETFSDDQYELGGSIDAPPVRAAIAHLRENMKPGSAAWDGLIAGHVDDGEYRTVRVTREPVPAFDSTGLPVEEPGNRIFWFSGVRAKSKTRYVVARTWDEADDIIKQSGLPFRSCLTGGGPFNVDDLPSGIYERREPRSS